MRLPSPGRIYSLIALCTFLGIAIPTTLPGFDGLASLTELPGRVQSFARGVLPAGSEQAQVVRVLDGDTLLVRVAGENQRVRLIGVDTPESVKPGVPVRCYAKAAARATRKRLAGRTVELSYDVDRHDKYGRTLAYVAVSGRDHGDWLVRRGYARSMAIAPNLRRSVTYSDSESRAQRGNRGLWGACTDAFPD